MTFSDEFGIRQTHASPCLSQRHLQSPEGSRTLTSTSGRAGKPGAVCSCVESCSTMKFNDTLTRDMTWMGRDTVPCERG